MQTRSPLHIALARVVRDILKDGIRTSLELFVVMVPAIVAVKILVELDLIRWLALPLEPVMGLVGLPGETGLVWASALLNNFYGGMAVFMTLPGMELTAAQATVLWTMLLVAHALPVELAVARRSGPRLLFQGVCRVGCALVLGKILQLVYQAGGWLQDPAVVVLAPPDTTDPGLWQWGLGQAKNLGAIFLVILALLVLLRILKTIRVIDLLNAMLKPVLRAIGIGARASAVTIIGLTLGLSYGGGLIIRESREGALGRRDVFYSLTLMGLSHALIEDTLVAVLLGAGISGALWGRLGFTLFFVALLVQVARRLPQRLADRFLWGPPRPGEDEGDEPKLGLDNPDNRR